MFSILFRLFVNDYTIWLSNNLAVLPEWWVTTQDCQPPKNILINVSKTSSKIHFFFFNFVLIFLWMEIYVLYFWIFNILYGWICNFYLGSTLHYKVHFIWKVDLCDVLVFLVLSLVKVEFIHLQEMFWLKIIFYLHFFHKHSVYF